MEDKCLIIHKVVYILRVLDSWNIWKYRLLATFYTLSASHWEIPASVVRSNCYTCKNFLPADIIYGDFYHELFVEEGMVTNSWYE